MLIATLMAVRAFPTRPAIAGRLVRNVSGSLVGCRVATELLDLGADPRPRLSWRGRYSAWPPLGPFLAVCVDFPRWSRLRSHR